MFLLSIWLGSLGASPPVQVYRLLSVNESMRLTRIVEHKVGQSHVYIYGEAIRWFLQGFIEYVVMYGVYVYIQFWPTLCKQN